MKRFHLGKLNGRKAVAGIVSIMLALSMLLSTGCKSPIQRAAEEQEERRKPKLIDYQQCYSEEKGYHYPGFYWGDSFGAFQKAADYPISELSGYSADNGTLYDAKDWRFQFGDFSNDSASVAADDEQRIRMIIFGIENNEISKEYFESYKDVLAGAFSVEPVKEERDEETEAGTFHYETYYFRKTLADKKETSIQWAMATKKGFEAPSIITFAFGCIFPEEEESSKAAK